MGEGALSCGVRLLGLPLLQLGVLMVGVEV